MYKKNNDDKNNNLKNDNNLIARRPGTSSNTTTVYDNGCDGYDPINVEEEYSLNFTVVFTSDWKP